LIAQRAAQPRYPTQTERRAGRLKLFIGIGMISLLSPDRPLALRLTLNPIGKHSPNEIGHRPPIKLRRCLKTITQLGLNP
jgi:hypothetical protein